MIRTARRVATAVLSLWLLGTSWPHVVALTSALGRRFNGPDPAPSHGWWIVAALAVFGLALLGRETARGLRPPTWLPAGLLITALLSGAPRAAGTAEPARDAAALLAEVHASALAELRRTGALTSPRAGPGPSAYRDRFGRRVTPRVLVLRDRDGPLLAPLVGARPGDLYVAVEPGGRFGWITAVDIDERGEPVLLRQGSSPVIAGAVRLSEEG